MPQSQPDGDREHDEEDRCADRYGSKGIGANEFPGQNTVDDGMHELEQVRS